MPHRVAEKLQVTLLQLEISKIVMHEADEPNRDRPMDHSTKSIAEFATRLTFDDLPAEVVHDCKRRIIDTIGCAIAAFDAEPVRIARAVATRAGTRARR